MTYNQHRIFENCQKFFQPTNRINVQIIGRFIHQQHIWIAKQCLSQQHPYLLVTVQILHQIFVKLLFDAQATQQLRRITLSIPTIHLRKLTFQLTRAHAIVLRKILLGIQHFLFLHNRPQFVMTTDYGLQNRIIIKRKVVLT